MINLSNTSPPAPAGGQNVFWQQDVSGDVSAYTSLSDTMTTVVPVAGVVTLNASLGNVFLIQVTMAVTSIVVTNQIAGQIITLLWYQISTGFTVTYSATFIGYTAPSTTAGTFSSQQFVYNLSDTNFFALSTGVQGMI